MAIASFAKLSDSSQSGWGAGNGGSYDKCRRRWDLADAEFLKYKYMQAFDRAMQHLDKAYGFICAPHQWVSRKVCCPPMVVLPAHLFFCLGSNLLGAYLGSMSSIGTASARRCGYVLTR